MTLATRRTRTSSEVTILGKVAGVEYVTVGDREYVAGRPSAGGPLTLRAEDLDMVEMAAKIVGGSKVVEPRHRRLSPVPTGTYAKHAAKADARRSKTLGALRPRPINALANVAALKGRPSLSVPVADHSGRPLGLPDPKDSALFIRGRDAVLDLDGALAFLADAGAVLRVVADGRLYIEAPRSRQADCVEVAKAIGRLAVGRLSGRPVACELGPHGDKAPEAVTILAVDVAACADCADGDRDGAA